MATNTVKSAAQPKKLPITRPRALGLQDTAIAAHPLNQPSVKSRNTEAAAMPSVLNVPQMLQSLQASVSALQAQASALGESIAPVLSYEPAFGGVDCLSTDSSMAHTLASIAADVDCVRYYLGALVNAQRLTTDAAEACLAG